MKNFRTDHCVQCGNPVRPTNFQTPNEGFIDRTGKYWKTGFWFCCFECYQKALNEYIDAPYHIGKTADMLPEWREMDVPEWSATHLATKVSDYRWVWGDYPDMVDRFRELETNFHKTQSDQVDKAIEVVYERLMKEHELLDQAEREKAEAKRLKEEARQQREAERQRKEQERLEEKRQRELERQMREQERLEEKRAKEEEKRRKEEEKQRLEAERLERMKPRPIPREAFFEHVHVLGGSGVGKSTLILERVIDLAEREDQPNIIVIDPKGPLVEKLSHYDLFALEGHRETVYPLILIDPTKFAPALNMFAKPKRTYSGIKAEQMENNTIALFQYIFSARDARLTDKQLTCFSYCVKLLFAIPHATIKTFLELLKDPLASKAGGIRQDSFFKPYIERLDQTAQEFFADYFYDPTEYAATKDQIATRIHGMLRYPTFQKMFLTTENKIDMFEFLQNPYGKVMLVASPEAMLGPDGSQLFCRYIVALAIQGAYERINIPESQWRPSYILMDEAHLMVDEVKTAALLTQMRHFKLGALLAHQTIRPQLSEAIFSTIAASTRIKIAATRSSAEAYAMSKDMRCEPEFIMDQKKVGDKLHFAVFCDGVTPHPFSYEIDAKINNIKLMDDASYRAMIDYQREKYGVTEVSEPQKTTEAPKQEASGGAPSGAKKSQPPKPSAPQKAPDSAADPHTGEHTEPASKWGSKKKF